jgi:molybdenum cofactor cytidylyltransferase
LVVLGDQPQIACEVVARLVQAFEKTRAKLIVPSYQQRRGHPWLVARSAWPAILALGPQETLRSFLNAYEAWIEYLLVESDTVLRDLDTPEDYSRERPLPA